MINRDNKLTIYIEDIDEKLVDLIPKFTKRRHKDLICIRESLKNNDFNTINHISHNIKGICGTYGFHILSEIGGQMEASSYVNDKPRIEALLSEYEEILNDYKIVSTFDSSSLSREG